MDEPTVPQIFVVEASAGSGKTSALAKRYVGLLLSSPAPQSILKTILAITFTNKASVEMKERILEFLKRIALDERGEGARIAELNDIAGAADGQAKERARAAMEELVRNYNFFQVQTIDSFINTLLSGCAFRLDLSARFKIKRSFSGHMALALDSVIEFARREPACAQLFDRYLSQYLFLENKTGWFPKKHLLETVTGLFLDTAAYGSSFRPYGAPADLFSKKRGIIELMRKLRDNEPEGANQQVFKGFRARLERSSENYDIGAMSVMFRRETPPMNKGHVLPPETAFLWNSIREEIRTLFETEAVSLCDPAILIFGRVYERFLEMTNKEDIVFLQELNARAHKLFEDGISVPELYFRLAARYRHYLIDEFQDTSNLQWKNLSMMIGDSLAEGGTLFYVGDKKQAIFRFRGGDASLFDAVRSSLGNYGADTLYLTKNFRSLPVIVDSIAKIFGPENLGAFLRGLSAEEEGSVLNEKDISHLLSIFSGAGQSAVSDSGGYCRFERVNEGPKEETSARVRKRVVETIADCRQRYGTYRGIAVLCRANREIEEITSWLLEENIPVESEKTLNVRSNPVIKEIVSLLRFLDMPVDNCALASFLTGGIFSSASGLPPEEMISFLFSLNSSKKGEHYIYRLFSAAYPSLWKELFEEFFKSSGGVPLYELIVSVLAKFKVLERFPGSAAFVTKLLEVASKLVNEENMDLSGFLEFMESAEDEELYVTVAEADAVRILTVHKAKGLGFPVVIVPNLQLNIQVPSRDKPYVPYEAEGNLRLLFLNKDAVFFSPLLSSVYAGEFKRCLTDELNTLYVALTRAARELYCFIQAKTGGKHNLACDLIPSDMIELGSRERSLVPAPPEPSLPLTLSVSKDWLALLAEEFGRAPGHVETGNIEEGEFAHAALSRLGADPQASEVEEAVLYASRLFPGIPPETAALIRGRILDFLNSPAGRPFFRDASSTVFTEREIVDASSTTLRIDRIVKGRDCVKIVDFKRSRPADPKQYRSQVRGYASAARELFSGKTIEGYLAYLDRAEVERVV